MAKAVLLALFTLCSTGVSRIVAAANNLTCQPGQTTNNNIENVGTFAIQCPDNTTVTPELPKLCDEGTVYRKPQDENDCCPIRDVLAGACIGKKDNQDIVVISQLPDVAKTFYIHCKKDGSKNGDAKKNNCVIAVVVAASPHLRPNTCSVKGSRIRLAIQRKDEVADFSCGEGRDLRPVDFKKKAYVEDCINEVDLPANVQVTEVTSAGKAYKVAAAKLPTEKTTICYVCEKSGTPPDKCEVTISIAASNASGALAVGFAARAAAVVGLTVAALRSWGDCSSGC